MRLAGGPDLLRQGLDEFDRDRLAPVAVAADPDGLVAVPLQRQRLGALQASGGVEADRLRRTGGGRLDRGPVVGAGRVREEKESREQRNRDAHHLVGTIVAR